MPWTARLCCGIELPFCSLCAPCLCLALLHYLQGDDFDAASGAGLDWEDNIGISAPLYDIVDEIFGLQSRGFVRRQVGLSQCGARSI